MDFLSTHLTVTHAVLVLTGFFFFLLGWMFLKFSRTTSELSRLMTDVRALLSGAQTIDLERYERLSERMRQTAILEHAWNKFDETVVRDDSGEKIQIYSTKTFSEFIPKEDFLEHVLHASWFGKVPSLITSLGLFFTFLFIVFGLMHLDPQKSGKIDGVDLLIKGLSSKFVSSVCAILYAILFTILESLLVRDAEHTCQILTDLLDARFQRKTSETYLFSLDKNMRELNHSMKRFSTDLAGVIKEGLKEGMRPSTDRLLVAIENLEKQKSENIADTLTKLLGEFKSSLNQSTGTEFAALGTSVTKLAGIMNSSAESSAAMSSRMDGLIAALDSQIQKHEQTSDASVAKLNAGFTNLLASIEKNTMIQNENLNRLLTDLVSKTSQATSGIVSNVESLSERNSTIVSGFSNLNANLSANIEQYMAAVEASKRMVQSTSDLARGLGGNLNQLAAVETRISQTFQNFMEQTTLVQGIQKNNAESVERFQRVFKEVETGLATVLKQLDDNLHRYNDLTRTGLEGYLKQYDDSLSTATTKLSSTVKDLDEVLENFGDHMDAIRAAVGKN